jgi:hypothetical protein
MSLSANQQSSTTWVFGGQFADPPLTDANQTRDWRIYAKFAQRLIAQARRLYADDELEVDLASTVYALDSTTIDLCLSIFPWARFRSTKAAVKLHIARSARRYSEFHPHLRRQAA